MTDNYLYRISPVPIEGPEKIQDTSRLLKFEHVENFLQ